MRYFWGGKLKPGLGGVLGGVLKGLGWDFMGTLRN